MTAMGMILDFKKNVIIWDDEALPMKQQGMITDAEVVDAIYFAHSNAPLLQDIEARQQTILDADYSKVDIDEMVDELDLQPDTKVKLKKTLKKFPILFGGGLGLLDIEPVKIELQPGAKPYKGKYYSTPKAYVNPLKKAIEDFCVQKILRKLSYNDDLPWALPSFGQPKKTGDIRLLTDFRKMNEAIERKPFPLPRIAEIIQRLEKFVSATALDLSQGYYSIPICEESQKLCTTILPWGKYAYQRLPMGIACAPDIFQSIMLDY